VNNVSQQMVQSLHEEAVAHATLAERSGELMWRHIETEYTQDVDKIAATLATQAPLAWTLAREADDAGAFHFLTGTSVETIRDQYAVLRKEIEINRWRALLELRQGWYTVTQGVCTLTVVANGYISDGETVTLFPVGTDGVLGELQVGIVGRRANGLLPVDDPDLPRLRLAALAAHEEYLAALRAEDVGGIVAAHAPHAAMATRSYLSDESILMNVNGEAEIRGYFSAFFERYRVRDVRLVNRIIERWYVFDELHWIVEERGDANRTLEYCTAELAPFDSDGRYWVRTGAGTDPIEG
jgi:hypothetical protein